MQLDPSIRGKNHIGSIQFDPSTGKKTFKSIQFDPSIAGKIV